MKSLLEQLGHLLDYPDEATKATLDAALLRLPRLHPDAVAPLAEWREAIRDEPLWSLQEAYTQTFDLNPSCTLGVGYYLFGEDYQRGLFLAHLRESQEEVGMTDEVELPDHVPVVLRWLARVYGEELYTDMVAECLAPVMRRIAALLAEHANPYANVAQAITLVLERDLAARGIPIVDRQWHKPDLSAALPMLGSPSAATTHFVGTPGSSAPLAKRAVKVGSVSQGTTEIGGQR